MSGPSRRPAIFLDRDGTLNESVGYVNHPSRFRLFPWSVEAIRAARDEGWIAAVITNQSGIGRGFFPETVMDEVHRELRRILEEAGTGIDGIFHCPHRPQDGCECRKPNPGMLLSAQQELGCDLTRSWVVGDSFSDLQAAWSVGARGAFVRSGAGEGALACEAAAWPRKPDLVADNVHSAVCSILWGPLA